MREEAGSGTIARRTVLAAGLGTAATVALAGCAAPTRGLRFWAMSYEGDYAPLLMPAFTRATGWPVEVQSLPWTAAHEKLLTAFAGRALPDAMMLPGDWIAEFAMIGAIAPLPDARFAGDLFPGLIDAVAAQGRHWAVPWSVSPTVQFFRRDRLADIGLDAPPADWIAWRDAARALQRRRPDAHALLLYLNWWDALFAFAAQTGAPLLRDRDTRGNFAGEGFCAALDFYVSLFDEGLAPRALSTDLQDPVGAFAQGLFAIYPAGAFLLHDLDRRQAEIPRAAWATARMPGPRGPAPASVINACIAVARSTPHPEAAWALVRHLTGGASELHLQRAIGNLPPRPSAWVSPQLGEPALAAFRSQLGDPAPGPRVVEWERIRLEVQLVAERIVRGELTREAGVAEMDRRVDALLARRRALVEAGVIA